MNLGMEDEHTEHKRSTSELREGQGKRTRYALSEEIADK